MSQETGGITILLALPHWHFDLRNGLSDRPRNINQLLQEALAPPRFGSRTALFRGVRGDLLP
jgi:hypothetical protein